MEVGSSEVTVAGLAVAIMAHVVAFVVWATKLHVRGEEHDSRIEALEEKANAERDAVGLVRERLASIESSLKFLVEQARK